MDVRWTQENWVNSAVEEMALALLPHNTSFRNLWPSLQFAHTWEKAFSLRDHFNWKLWQPVTETLLETYE